MFLFSCESKPVCLNARFLIGCSVLYRSAAKYIVPRTIVVEAVVPVVVVVAVVLVVVAVAVTDVNSTYR